MGEAAGRRRAFRRPVAVVVSAATALALCACSAPDLAARAEASRSASLERVSPSPSRPSAEAGKAQRFWHTDGDPFGPLLAVDGVTVGLERRDDRLFVQALDPATGRRLWDREASPGFSPPGIVITVDKVRGASGPERVAYLRPTSDTDHYANVVVADARTGADVWVSTALQVTTMPRPCDDGLDVCVEDVQTSGTGAPERLRIDDGRLVPEPDGGLTGVERIGDAGLFRAVDHDNAELLGAMGPNGPRWTAYTEDLFGKGFTSGHGWDLSYYPREQIFVGSVGGPVRMKPGSEVQIASMRLADSTTAAFDARTGKLLWREPGTHWACGGATVRRRTFAVSAHEPPGAPVRCRASGTVVYTGTQPSDYEVRDHRVTVEGFDLRTGRTTWTLPLGSEDLGYPGSFSGGDWSDADHLTLWLHDEPQVIDLRTGELRDPETGESFVCLQGTSMDYYVNPVDFGNGNVFAKRRGFGLFAQCDAYGDTTGPAPTADQARFYGAVFEDLAALALEKGWSGYVLG